MKLNLLRKLSRRERRLEQRIDKANWSGQSPMIAPPAIQYELADRVPAMNAGGLGVVQQMVKQLGLAKSINRGARSSSCGGPTAKPIMCSTSLIICWRAALVWSISNCDARTK